MNYWVWVFNPFPHDTSNDITRKGGFYGEPTRLCSNYDDDDDDDDGDDDDDDDETTTTTTTTTMMMRFLDYWTWKGDTQLRRGLVFPLLKSA